MCAKPEPFNYYQPVAELHEEVAASASESNILPDLSWVGVQAYYGLLESV